MLSTNDAAEPIMTEAAAEPRARRDWAPLAVPPLTILLLIVSGMASTPTEFAVAALSFFALALAAVAFAASSS